MNHPINQENWSDDSSEFEHPNIEKGTLKRLVREKKRREKEEKQRKLDQLKTQLAENYNEELEEEKIKLEEELRPRFIETDYVIENNQIEEDPNDMYTEQLLFLGSDPKIENFIKFVEENRKLDLNHFCDFLYINLAENIREGYDEAGLIISKLILYLRHLQNGGLSILKQMQVAFEDEKKLEEFDKQCQEYLDESKISILNLQKQ
ncbi:putative Cdc37 [Pseudoloma neurophilia]|uniref:Putative Cdc37 n=1 Tax=Pseudoloma neurophilia TaxID=146866 RepID=A0A0R0M4Y9_9MICR|nr:putative Cdc37 [Pseudoloma neurophilia]